MRYALAAVVVLLAGCIARAPPPLRLPALEDEGELYVYLDPLPREAQRVTFAIASLAAVNDRGLDVPLTVVRPEYALEEPPSQRLVARGRLPPGAYVGLSARFAKATLSRPEGEGAADLLIGEEPTRIEVSFKVERGRAGLIEASLRRVTPPDRDFAFAPSFSATALQPAHTLSQLDGYCTNEALASITVFDKHRHEVVAAIASGREPQGLALDSLARRLYVALAGQDQVQVIDLSTGDEVRRVSLQPGDRPRELALTADGTLLLVVNAGTSTVAFVDPSAGAVLDRVAVGEEPTSVLLDRAGRRAYVFNRRSNDVTALDVSKHSVIATSPTDAEPVRGQLNRAGTRLYVIHEGSQYLAVFSVPELTLLSRLYVGPGASAVKVDPRTDLIYVALSGESRIQVFDAFALIPLEWIDVPGPVSYLAIDDAENALLALVPSLHEVVFTNLTSKKAVGIVEVGEDPSQVTVEGERY